MTFQYHHTTDGDLIDCFECGSDAPTHKFETDQKTEYLCRYCANSTIVMCSADSRKVMAQMFNALEEILMERQQ